VWTSIFGTVPPIALEALPDRGPGGGRGAKSAAGYLPFKQTVSYFRLYILVDRLYGFVNQYLNDRANSTMPQSGGVQVSGASQQSIVIVGAGQAGGRAAEALRAAQFTGSITMIGGESHLPYERPQLSKSLLLDPAVAPSFLRSSEEWSALGIDVHTGADATECDLARRVVGLADGREFKFDKLLFATGTRPRRLPALEEGPVPVYYLRGIDDALILRDALARGRRVVLVGGGVIGLEVAAAATERGCSVTVVEAMPDVLAQVGSPTISGYFNKLHAARHVTFLTGVTAVRSVPGGLEVSDGTLCPADFILVGIGVEPALDLASQLGLPSQHGIPVDRHGATELDGVYAAGDVALQWNRCCGRSMRIENWANAQNQAAATAKAMLGQDGGYDAVPWFWSDQYKVNLQVVGSLAGVEEVVRGDIGGDRFSVIGVRDGEIVGGATVNAPKDMAMLRRMVTLRKQPNRGDLEDPGFDLKRVLSA
jgi:p-cumate 2,3-dioxygenase ferredoxin reductase subunit